MEESLQTFEALVTELHPSWEAESLMKACLPAGIVRVQETGREAGKALLLAGLIAVLSIALFGVLFFGHGKEADVVWQEDAQSVQSVLVEGP